jgi:hypothetical protein
MSAEEITRFNLDMDGSMEPSDDGRWIRYEDHLQAIAKAEAGKQEPVAWRKQVNPTEYNYCDDMTDFPTHENFGWKPLYDHPPQRQPLTDEQRKRILNDNTVLGYHGEYFDAWGIIDDVEAAHGIKGEA